MDDCKRVIEHKRQQWADDSKMSAYLRPSTLFRLSNFENYLDDAFAAGVQIDE